MCLISQKVVPQIKYDNIPNTIQQSKKIPMNNFTKITDLGTLYKDKMNNNQKKNIVTIFIIKTTYI